MSTPRVRALIAAAGLTVSGAVMAISVEAQAHMTGIHDNCTNFNNRYPHGVGRRHAHDKGGDVTNCKRSNRIYNRAERHNPDLDRYNAHIACEKA